MYVALKLCLLQNNVCVPVQFMFVLFRKKRKCTYCDAEKETLLHRFCTCVKVASLWENVSSWIESKLKCELVLKPFNMLFGVECNHRFYTIIKCLPLHARFLILWCKTAKNMPNIICMYYLVVENAKTIEKRIA